MLAGLLAGIASLWVTPARCSAQAPPPPDHAWPAPGNSTWQVWLPKGAPPTGALLLLPGYRHTPQQALAATRLDDDALARGLAVVCLAPGRSVYPPRAIARTLPTDQQLAREDLCNLPAAFNTQLGTTLGPGAWAVAGFSTGARGVAHLAQTCPSHFAIGLAAAGDYVPALLRQDPLLTRTYGPQEQNPTLWDTAANAMWAQRPPGFPLLVAHGLADATVAPAHSQEYAEWLLTLPYSRWPPAPCGHAAWLLPGIGHRYGLWDAVAPAFFRAWARVGPTGACPPYPVMGR